MLTKYLKVQLQENTNLLPIVSLRGKVAFPHTNVSFEVGREITLKAIDRASATDRTVFILTQRQTEKTDVTADDLYAVGCVAKIKQIANIFYYYFIYSSFSHTLDIVFLYLYTVNINLFFYVINVNSLVFRCNDTLYDRFK